MLIIAVLVPTEQIQDFAMTLTKKCDTADTGILTRLSNQIISQLTRLTRALLGPPSDEIRFRTEVYVAPTVCRVFD
eukprot:scaffold54386_cov46-Attheya_sp.AAC.4